MKLNFLVFLFLREDHVTAVADLVEKFGSSNRSQCGCSLTSERHWVRGHCVLCVCPASVGPRGDRGPERRASAFSRPPHRVYPSVIKKKKPYAERVCVTAPVTGADRRGPPRTRALPKKSTPAQSGTPLICFCSLNNLQHTGFFSDGH